MKNLKRILAKTIIFILIFNVPLTVFADKNGKGEEALIEDKIQNELPSANNKEPDSKENQEDKSILTEKIDLVDLTFTVNGKSYYSKQAKKELDTPPFVEKGSTMVPFRIILEELGYQIEWNGKEKSIKATNGASEIKLQINSKTAWVNDQKREMTSPPKVVGKSTVVPLRFIAENSGAEVKWDGKSKTIYITKNGEYNTGKALFYEKKFLKLNTYACKVYIYDGEQIKTITLEDKEIINWFSFKGKVLVTMFDKSTNKNNFMLFKDDRFKMLIEDFDIKETLEYNDNLIINGLDRSQKFNKLYRFDGNELILLSDDFYVGKHILFKDKLVINKYDNLRNYTLLAYGKDSWEPGILTNGFIIKDWVDYEGVLYMTGAFQETTRKPFATYNGNSVTKESYNLLAYNLDIDINNIAIHNGKLYGVVQDLNEKVLMTIEKDAIKYVTFPYEGSVLKYIVNKIKAYNNKLYVGTTSAKVQKGTFWMTIPDDVMPSALIELQEETSETYLVKRFVDEYLLSDLLLENKKLIALGKGKTKVGKISRYDDPAMYVYDGSSLTKTMDILSIISMLSIGEKTFFHVKDVDRITNKSRNTMLLYAQNVVKNLVLGMETKKWSEVSGNVVFAGYEDDIKRNKLYSYGTGFNELMDHFEIRFWGKIEDKLFVSGYNPDRKGYSLFKFIDDKKIELKEEIEVIDMLKSKGQFYFIHAYERNSKSKLFGKKVLFIYDDLKNEFIEMKTDIEITKMIYIE
ncbi:MAG: copper amine oxidase N-terminal domain-containing protein [Clostridia bacterium]|nr:copper amine oxidase N-terminal domain-containing protein [Clostridia bacterium]